MAFDSKIFFDYVRKRLHGGLSQEQVDLLNGALKAAGAFDAPAAPAPPITPPPPDVPKPVAPPLPPEPEPGFWQKFGKLFAPPQPKG